MNQASKPVLRWKHQSRFRFWRFDNSVVDSDRFAQQEGKEQRLKVAAQIGPSLAVCLCCLLDTAISEVYSPHNRAEIENHFQNS